tara:strand:- start:84 stop:644 length:561 start_codon:yes stop_codon:yes gene_type:complete
MLKINQQIPESELEAYHENQIKKIKIHEQKDKWLILVFYPADFTFVCPTELGEYANLYKEFQNEGSEIMSVSTDTVFTHKAWHDKSETINKIKFPMLADPTGKLCKQFGTYIREEGLSLRGTFIIDPEGKLMSIEINNNDIGRNANETLRKLRAAKFTKEHDEVCPANWQPGKDTLKPGLDLVGQI